MPRTKKLKAGATEKQITAQVLEAAKMLGIELKRRNVGGMTNGSGRYVAFAEPGDSDYYAILPDGRHLDLEIKKEGFDPSRLSGKARDHFDRQLARLRKTNELNGVAFWTEDSAEAMDILRHVLAGARVIEPGYGRPVISYE